MQLRRLHPSRPPLLYADLEVCLERRLTSLGDACTDAQRGEARELLRQCMEEDVRAAQSRAAQSSSQQPPSAPLPLPPLPPLPPPPPSPPPASPPFLQPLLSLYASDPRRFKRTLRKLLSAPSTDLLPLLSSLDSLKQLRAEDPSQLADVAPQFTPPLPLIDRFLSATLHLLADHSSAPPPPPPPYPPALVSLPPLILPLSLSADPLFLPPSLPPLLLSLDLQLASLVSAPHDTAQLARLVGPLLPNVPAARRWVPNLTSEALERDLVAKVEALDTRAAGDLLGQLELLPDFDPPHLTDLLSPFLCRSLPSLPPPLLPALSPLLPVGCELDRFREFLALSSPATAEFWGYFLHHAPSAPHLTVASTLRHALSGLGAASVLRVLLAEPLPQPYPYSLLLAPPLPASDVLALRGLEAHPARREIAAAAVALGHEVSCPRWAVEDKGVRPLLIGAVWAETGRLPEWVHESSDEENDGEEDDDGVMLM
ncbi:hypothetical protein TeGR_g10412 [Tetraparma gracilis]|uniref:Uncharacterized protein n=1 Tax=Tetraparma gracilis TaxID=2962635 RepID=A0ABQ6MC65_9STRA|nr:hypothetical protein TeGR_g10412 [Tetraparma gracilis]